MTKKKSHGSGKWKKKAQEQTAVKAHNRFKRWEKRDIHFLQTFYQTMKIQELALAINRSYKSIKSYLSSHRKLFPRV